ISVLVGQLVVGMGIGAGAALVARRAGSGRASAFVLGATVLLWIATAILLWPTLTTHFGGLPSPLARVATLVGLGIVYLTFAIVLLALRRSSGLADDGVAATHSPSRVARRTVLTAGVGLGLLAVSGTILERLRSKATFSYDGTRVDGPDISPITPNDRFYVVTKNVVDPGVDAGLWRLDVAGLVDRPQSYDFAAFMALPAVDQETTLMCISNSVGGGLMSNAIWRGVPLADLLAAAGVGSAAVEVLCHAVDGYTDTMPIAKALERTTLLAYHMNGEPLPGRHGYPVRLLVPGMYGEKSLKWIDRLEVVDREASGFYEQQGWGPDFVIPTRSRFSGPDLRGPLPAGQPVHLVGQAFGGDRGIASVEVSADGGTTWGPAVLDYPGTELTWALWSLDWTPKQAGEYRLAVRATDRAGGVQTSAGRAIVPEGARGLHVVTATVQA
ncbi:MAG: molybdopterin-dependent oxidoreductase, partial [Candidatus Limnocylindrales bacterium]